MSLNERLDKLMARNAKTALGHHGERGAFVTKAGALLTPVVQTPALLSWNELPLTLDEFAELGHQVARREALFVILLDQLAANVVPAIDDTLVLTTGPATGTWTIIGIESRDVAAITVRARMDKARRSNAAGAVTAP